MELQSPFTGLEDTKAVIDFVSTDTRTSLVSSLHLNPIEAEMNSTFENEMLRSDSLVVFNGKRFVQKFIFNDNR